MISVALNASVKKICREISSVMYERCRFVGSGEIWFWLARIMSGSSQHDSTRRGVDNGSVARYRLDVVHPVSESHFSHVRLTVAIIRLW